MSDLDLARLDLARRAEEAGLNALPAPRQVLLGGVWLLRFADGCTRRANSVNPLRPEGREGAGDGLDARIRRAGALYAAQGLPCLFRVLSFHPPRLDAALDARGYAPPEGETRVLFRRPAGLGGEAANPPLGIELAEGQPGGEWLDGQARIAGDGEGVARARAAMLAGLAIPAAFAAARPGAPGTPPMSLAYAAVHDGLTCVNMVATDPAARGRGLARGVVSALLEWASGAGAATGACLQVAADNLPAIRLYEGLGFRRELYRYHYRRLAARG